MTMFPDLGLYICELGEIQPFELAVFNDLMLGEEGINFSPTNSHSLQR